MNFQDHSEGDAKAHAALQLEKLKRGPSKRKRKKRELEEGHLPLENLAHPEELLTSLKVRGTESWAPLQAGSVKRVKKFVPSVSSGSALLN